MYTVAKVWNQSSENCLVGKYAFVLVSKNANKKDFYNIVKGIARSLITSLILVICTSSTTWDGGSCILKITFNSLKTQTI